MKLLKSEEEYFRIILEKYENMPGVIKKKVYKDNNISDNQYTDEINENIFKQFLNNKNFSCWIDVFLFISTYTVNLIIIPPTKNFEKYLFQFYFNRLKIV